MIATLKARALTVMIVDDEPLARRGLRLRLERLREARTAHTDNLTIIDAQSARDCLEKLEAHHVDVLFLDIQMPGVDGLSMIRALPNDKRPLVIFTTAFDQYALDAFGVQAVDYLLKPVDGVALKRAWLRAIQLLALPAEQGADATDGTDSLALKDGKEVNLIHFDKLLWIEAAGDYVVAHTGNARFIGRISLNELEANLPSQRFVRIHRSTIVQKRCIVRLRPHTNGEFFLELENGHRLKLSRGYRDRVAALMA
jgi:two-component system, LytTR family, response regulator